ncbi:MAG: reverse transcriptase family protein [Saprospiraceae bacterium]
MSNKLNTAKHLQNVATRFCNLKSVEELPILLKIKPEKLQAVLEKPTYKTLKIPKAEGKERLIEDATGDLKRIQKTLNMYLQSTYYTIKTKAAFGYVTNARYDNDVRTYVTGALRHQKQLYLLNIDLQDFFHHITDEMILRLFQYFPFHFPTELAEALTKLVCYNGRLPMGTHTSPSLSNFALRQLDLDLQSVAHRFYWQYTRYADDMSFSSKEVITEAQLKVVRSVIRKKGFEINDNKTQWFTPDDVKIVTGILVLDDGLDLPKAFLNNLQEEVNKLKDIIDIQNQAGSVRTMWVDKFKRTIRGKLNYLMIVKGRGDLDYIQLTNEYKAAIRPPAEEFGALSWKFFPYSH